MLNSIWEETKKMLHSKLIIIMLFVIPIATNILIGFEFQGDQIKHIPMAVVDHDQSSLSRMIIQQFADNETFAVQYVLQSEDQLKALIQDGDIKTGMIIPEHFSQEVAQLEEPNILMIYDGSHMSIASTAKSKASEILLTLKTGISMKLIAGKLNLPADIAERTAQAIKFNNRFLYNPARSYKQFLNPGLGVAAVQTAIVLLGAVCIRREKLRGGLIADLGYISGKIMFYTLMGTVSLLCSVFIQNRIFGIPFRGTILSVLVLNLMLALAEAAFSVAVSVWVTDTLIASLVVAVLFIPSTALAGYTWPVLSMPEIYKHIAYLMPFAHYGTPLRNLYLKGIPFKELTADLEWLCGYTLFSFAAAFAGIARLALRFSRHTGITIGEGQ